MVWFVHERYALGEACLVQSLKMARVQGARWATPLQPHASMEEVVHFAEKVNKLVNKSCIYRDCLHDEFARKSKATWCQSRREALRWPLVGRTALRSVHD